MTLAAGIAGPALPQRAVQHAAGTPTRGHTGPDISVEAVMRGVGPDVLIKGRGFTPGGLVRVRSNAPPGAARRLDFGSVRADSTGRFVLRREEACTVTSAANLEGVAGGTVTFLAVDETTTRGVQRAVPAGPWGC